MSNSDELGYRCYNCSHSNHFPKMSCTSQLLEQSDLECHLDMRNQLHSF